MPPEAAKGEIRISDSRDSLVVIVGPSGVGKSRVAIDLAREFRGEIINSDSRQIYRFMDIGTAKPTSSEMSVVPHHLFNIINPDESFGLAQYQKLAIECIREVQRKGRIPFIVGGSGQYIWSIVEGWKIPKIPPNPDYRKELENIAARRGIDDLYRQLIQIDPVGADKIDKRNIRRVIRALEVSSQSGSPFSQAKQKIPPNFKILIIGLTLERAVLYRNTDIRVDNMVREGLIQEIENLVAKGYNLDLPAMNSIGYSQIGKYFDKQLTIEEAIDQIKVDTHRFIRHQYSWFKLKDARICWFENKKNIVPYIMHLLDYFLQR